MAVFLIESQRSSMAASLVTQGISLSDDAGEAGHFQVVTDGNMPVLQAEVVYSLNGFCWYRTELMNDSQEGALQGWRSEELDIPPGTALWYWIQISDVDGTESSSLDSMRPFQYQSSSACGDLDGDGLSDAWEQYWWNSLEFSGSDNPDADRVAGIDLNNEYELFLGTDPTALDCTEGIFFIWHPLKPHPEEAVRLVLRLDPTDEMSSGQLYAFVSCDGDLRRVPLAYSQESACYSGELIAPDTVQDLSVILANEEGLVDDNYRLGWTIPMRDSDTMLSSSARSAGFSNADEAFLEKVVASTATDSDFYYFSYVNALTGSSGFDGSRSAPVQGSQHGPKKRIDSGVDALSPAGGAVVIADGIYDEDGLKPAGKVVLKVQGHVIIR